METITTCLWFDDKAEEAANFYVSIFPNSKINGVARYTEVGPGKPGSVMTVDFELNGQQFLALNGGPLFPFTEAISLVVNCETQQEIDHFWSKLAEGGKEQPCGWVKDKFGLCWQVIPNALPQMLMDEDSQKAQRVMKSMLQMSKIDIDALKRAQAA